MQFMKGLSPKNTQGGIHSPHTNKPKNSNKSYQTTYEIK